jgi:hypothetical protein
MGILLIYRKFSGNVGQASAKSNLTPPGKHDYDVPAFHPAIITPFI